MDKNKNLGQPDQEKRQGQPNQQEHIRKNEPVMDNNPSGKDKSSDRSQEQGQGQSGEWKRPLTNQDEERKSTNVGKTTDNPTGEEESEGDERLKPYKNVGDDSEEVEKKTPTME
jgi:hypothetical protein